MRGSDKCSGGSCDRNGSSRDQLWPPWALMTPHLFVSLCGASFFVGSDFFRAKSWDPHVPLALCKEEASTEIRGLGGQGQLQCDPQTRIRGYESKQSAKLSNSNPAEGFYGIQIRESRVVRQSSMATI